MVNIKEWGLGSAKQGMMIVVAWTGVRRHRGQGDRIRNLCGDHGLDKWEVSMAVKIQYMFLE